MSGRKLRPRSARFHGIIAPTGRIAPSTTMKGVKAMSKNGGPTESLRSNSISATRGQIVPMKTTKQETASRILFITSALSRLARLNTPLASIALARAANRVSAPPMKKPRIIRMNTPRSGSLAKA